ncbi:hypothetical protein [Algiphilus sp.]|uniref:hypothetical protein n=1 Tax=Algiphilus sp. TaxID=1872431 RepID=UPI0032EBC0F4
MANDLKVENAKHVYWLLALPVLICAAIQAGSLTTSVDKWVEIAAIESVTGATLYAVALLLANLLPPDLKHKLVFTRLRNEMPAGRIHLLTRTDPRIHPGKVQEKWPHVFDPEIEEAERNALWYQQIYKPVRDNVPVRQSHRMFLLFRDVTSGLAFLCLASGSWAFLGMLGAAFPLNQSIPVVLLAFTVTTLIAARNAGNRMVLTAVAEAS